MAAPYTFRHLLGRIMVDTEEGGGAPAAVSSQPSAPAPAPVVQWINGRPVVSAPGQPAQWSDGSAYRGNSSVTPVYFDMQGNVISDAYPISQNEFFSPSRNKRYQNVAWMLDGYSGDSSEPNYSAFPWLRGVLEIYGGNIQIGAADADVNYSEIEYAPSVPWVAAPASAPAPTPIYTAPDPAPALPGVTPVVNPDTGQVQYTAPPAPSGSSGLPVYVVTPSQAPAPAPVSAGGGAAPRPPVLPGQMVSAGGGEAPSGTPGGSNNSAPDAQPSNARALILAALAAIALMN